VRRDLEVPEGASGEDGLDRSLEDAIAGWRIYRGIRLGGTANHVFAIRASAGVGSGPGADAFHFDLGGAEGQPETVTGLGLFGGHRLTFPLRGLERGIKSGSRIWSASAEYRVPLARANAGMGTFPLHFDEVYLTAFADAGDAWGPDTGLFNNPAGDPVVSVGAELAVEVLPFWTIPLVMRGGVAVPVSGLPEQKALFHFRLGVSF
jgi:outer membrane protein assembly factor BamA